MILSQRRACGLIGITRRGLKRAPVVDRNRGLRQRLRELAEARRRWGCPLLYLMLRREGWRANHKRVERLYREEGLSLRRKRRRKRLSHLRVARERPVAANQTWAVDFIHDSLISGRHFRAFAIHAAGTLLLQQRREFDVFTQISETLHFSTPARN